MRNILNLLEKKGYEIESSESDLDFLSFYCNKDNERYFIKIKVCK